MNAPPCHVVPQDGSPIAANLAEPPREVDADYEYFVNICRHLVQDHGITDANFLIAHDASGPLPDLDERSIVMLTGDERCRLPAAAARARLILKCFGERPRYVHRWTPELASLVDRGRHLGEVARWRMAARAMGAAHYQALLARLHPMPMGYCRQAPLPLVPIAQRRHLLSFAGSVDNQKAGQLSYQRLVDYPKRAARLRMLEALQALQRELGPEAVALKVTASFGDSLAAAGAGYAEMLMQTKICICPRGTRMETFRIHEGLRFGCVVVAEQLPDVWYFQGSPVIQIRAWSELAGIVRGLRADPAWMQELHERSLAWWREVCSPAAVAAHVARLLQAPQPAPAALAVPGLAPAYGHSPSGSVMEASGDGPWR